MPVQILEFETYVEVEGQPAFRYANHWIWSMLMTDHCALDVHQWHSRRVRREGNEVPFTTLDLHQTACRVRPRRTQVTNKQEWFTDNCEIGSEDTETV